MSENTHSKAQIENIESSTEKNQETRTSLADLKESIEVKKQIDIIKNSKLSELDMFDEFILYVEGRAINENSKEELNQIILLINNGFLEDLIKYFDINNPKDGYGFFNDIPSFNDFKEYFKNNLINKAKQSISIDVNNATTDVNNDIIDVNKTSADVNKTSADVNKTSADVNNESEIQKDLYIKSIETLQKHKDKLGYILDGLNNEKSIEVNIDYLKDNQEEIFKVLKQEAKDTNNTEDLREVADNFFKLKIIDQSSYDEIYVYANKIDKPDYQSKTPPPSPIITGYTSRGNTLYKQTEDTNFTIRDGKIISVSRDTGFKLVDYSTLDAEGKAFAEKTKFQSEIAELNINLLDNKSKKEVLDQIYRITQNKDINSITEEDIDIVTLDIINKIPILKDTVEKINLSKESSGKKLEYIIKLLYGNITGTTNTSEINSKELTYMIFTCNGKLEDSNDEINKKLEKAKKEIEIITEKFPNLDEKSIQEKIKSQETRMQDTVKFCDDYGLSALGHIAYIKKVIVEFNKKEVDNQIPLDIGTGTDFMLKDNLPIYSKHMAKLLGRKEDQIYRTDEKGLLDYDKTNQKRISALQLYNRFCHPEVVSGSLIQQFINI